MAKESPLEKIQAYYNIQPFLTADDWLALGTKLEIDPKEAEDRIRGKVLEDSFFLIARCYSNVEAVIVFNETLTTITRTPSADGLIIFKNGEKIMVEVKSTIDSYWSISEKRLESQRKLADRMGFKLVYAIHHKDFWGVYDAEFLASNKRRVKHPQNLKFSLFDTMFNSMLIKVPRGLQVIRRFSMSNEPTSPVGIFSDKYGHVTDYLICYGNNVQRLNSTFAARAFFAIENSISDTMQIYKVSDRQTDVVCTCPMDTYVNDCRLSIDFIQIMINEKNEQRFNNSTFLAHAVGEIPKSGLDFTKGVESGLNLIRLLINGGIPFEIVKASETDYLRGHV